MFSYKINDTMELRQIDYIYADQIFALTDNNREHLKRYLPWVDATKSAEDTRAFFKTCLQQQIDNNGFQASIWVENKPAGMVGFHDINNEQVGAIGYWLGKEFTGQGVMTQAVQALINYAFSNLELNKIEIKAATTNKASRAIPERLGFVHEGTSRQAEKTKDGFRDMEIYGLLKQDWDKKTP